jgi:hypothetical protein
MILSNALLVLGLSGPDLVLVSGRQAGRVGSRFGAAIEGQLASWEAQPLHPRMPSDNQVGSAIVDLSVGHGSPQAQRS